MPSKIKVLQVIPKLGYGGAETGCYDIAHYLYEKDCGSYIVTSGGDLLKFVDKKKVKIICTMECCYKFSPSNSCCEITRPCRCSTSCMNNINVKEYYD